MARRRVLGAVFALGLLWVSGQVHAGVDVRDTKLLAQPAVSASHLAFVYAEDLWVATLDGKEVRRLTSDVGVESNPVFAPDGKRIAFSGQYDGNTDVYTIPIEGGTPTRLTWHPGPDVVRGFAPDGNTVLFTSPRHVFTRRFLQLFTVPLTGGFPNQLPIPNGVKATYSPDGSMLAYTPLGERFEQWKNYRGGTHTRIWLFRFKDNGVEQIPQPQGRCNDSDPQWLDGETVLFRSDRNGEFNLFTYNRKSKAVNQLTRHTDFPVLAVAVGGGNVVYEQAGQLQRLHLAPGGQVSSVERLRIGVAADLPETRARFVKGSGYVRGSGVSPSGARAVFEVRGEIVTVPAEKGDPRNLTNTTGAHERSPSWSPDGKTIAYFSDAAGEYELCLAPQNGKGNVNRFKVPGSGFFQDPVWSRDSKKIVYRDNSLTLYWLDVATGVATKIASELRFGGSRDLKPMAWSPDSQWLTYTLDNAASISTVYAYSLKEKKSFPITDGLSEASAPVFDANGKYLYFFGSTDTGMSKHGFSQSASDSRPPRRSLYLAVLRSGQPSPFARESDEEKGSEAEKGKEPEKEPTIDEKGAPKSGEPDAGKGRKGMAKGRPGARPAPFRIDRDGLDQRIIAFPLPAGNFGNLQTGAAGQVFYLEMPERSGGGRRGGGPGMFAGGQLHRYDLEKRKDDVIQPSVMTFELTPDGKKMLYATNPQTWIIGSTGGGGPTGGATALAAAMGKGRRGGGGGESGEGTAGAEPGSGRLNLDAIEVRIDPKVEWPQIFAEAWRINRDYFYAPNMHGANWPAMREKYAPFLEHCATRNDLNRVIQWMCSELAVGHHRGGGGDRLHTAKSVKGGLLGADFEIVDGRYRFKKVYGGLNWSPELRAPLTVPGVNVKAGEFLLSVNGKDLRAPIDIYSVFENTAGKMVEIIVGPKADGAGSRTVTVEPIDDETDLRNRDWVEGNLRKVQQATGGRVAYVYVPDTAGMGLTYFKRYFFPQIDKEAVIVDERFNSGGQIADYYIDILRRPFLSYWAPRYGVDWRSPSAAIFGPKVMIIDESAGSGGDMLPWMFRKLNLGTLIGKRTWGGLVGVSGYPTLMDGGSITAPNFAIWTPDEGWIVENQGVPPDIEVEQLPADVIAGRDPQLEKAIEVVMAELKKQPAPQHKRPPPPVRAGQPGPLSAN